MLPGETLSPTRLISHYMKAFSKRDKIKVFIAPKMTDLITFLYKNGNILSTQEEILMDYIII